MRLLHTTSLKLQDFQPDAVPEYAILSHTWEEEEVTLQDLETGRWRSLSSSTKISGICSLACKNKHQYIWIDTVSIDKTSSAELTEAINSMFAWYQNAIICYAYLSDVPSDTAVMALPPHPPNSLFRRSRWFTRGWTLQELLAPKEVVFLDQEFQRIGLRSHLQNVLAQVTGISLGYLKARGDARLASVAQKMSWASRRNTTRPEDLAYSLIGLFGAHMPLLYGEGLKSAFIRLQLEIMARSDDESIFAWDWDITPESPPKSMLAESPRFFANSSHIVQPENPYMFDLYRPPYSMTNKGLRIETYLWQGALTGTAATDAGWKPLQRHQKTSENGDTDKVILMPLNCAAGLETGKHCLAVPLERTKVTRPAPKGIRNLSTRSSTVYEYRRCHPWLVGYDPGPDCHHNRALESIRRRSGNKRFGLSALAQKGREVIFVRQF